MLLPFDQNRKERKVRTPEGRMVANSDSGRPEESATENTPLYTIGVSAVVGSKGEMVR